MPDAKRKATADGRESPSQLYPVAAHAAESGDCPGSELVASETDEPEITTPMDQLLLRQVLNK